MKQTANTILKTLVEFLNHNDEEARKLWWVLTALRGPDYDDHGKFGRSPLKDATTSVVRHAIGLRQGVGNGATVIPDSAESATLRNRNEVFITAHFYSHMREAFRALGLSWLEENK